MTATGYNGLQISLKDARGALLNITGSTPEELLKNYQGVQACDAFAGFFTLSPQQVEQVLNTPAAPAAAPVAAAKTVQTPGAPATDKQLALIAKRGGTATPNMTKGEASALIDSLIAKG